MGLKKNEFGQFLFKKRKILYKSGEDLAQKLIELDVGLQLNSLTSKIYNLETGTVYKKLDVLILYKLAEALQPKDISGFLSEAFQALGLPAFIEYLPENQYSQTLIDLQQNATILDPAVPLEAMLTLTASYLNTWQICYRIKRLIIDEKKYAQVLPEIEKHFGSNLLHYALEPGNQKDFLLPIDPAAFSYLCDMMGNSLIHTGNPSEAIKPLELAIRLANSIRNSDTIPNPNLLFRNSWLRWLAITYDHLTDANRIVSNTEQAAEAARRFHSTAIMIKDDVLIAKARRKIALNWLVTGSYMIENKQGYPITIMELGKEIVTQLPEDGRSAILERAKWFSTIGWGYRRYGDLIEAIEMYKKAISYLEPFLNDNFYLYEKMKSYRYLGEVYLEDGQMDLAGEALKQAKNIGVILKIFGEMTNMDPEVAMIYRGLGIVYSSTGNSIIAKNNLLKASEELDRAGHMNRLGMTYTYLARFELQKNPTKLETALDYFQLARKNFNHTDQMMYFYLKIHIEEIKSLLEYFCENIQDGKGIDLVPEKISVLKAEIEVAFENIASGLVQVVREYTGLHNEVTRSRYWIQTQLLKYVFQSRFELPLDITFEKLIVEIHDKSKLDKEVLFQSVERLGKSFTELEKIEFPNQMDEISS